MPRLLCALLSLLAVASASAVTMDFTSIGNPGNACDPNNISIGLNTGCFGSLSYPYQIGTYEVTNAQYVEFLNAKAASDPLALYNTSMANTSSGVSGGNGGITRSGSSGSYTYSTIAGREDRPVNWVSFYDAARFANWMNNGQGNGDTESGAYTLLGGTATPSNGTTVTRNGGAQFVLPNNNEWYKAAYYAPSTSSYFDYPTGTNTQPTCSTPTATANRANCNSAAGSSTTIRGSYSGSASPYGTFDQGGNVYEWSEAIPILNSFVQSRCGVDPGLCREIYGAAFYSQRSYLVAGAGDAWPVDDAHQYGGLGFRLAYIPEPSTGLLVIVGIVSLAGWRRGRR